MSERLSGSLQENLLTLSCYSKTAFQLVRNSVPVNLFTTSEYREIMKRVYAFIDQFRKPPRGHLSDLVEDLLDGKKGRLYRSIIEAAYKLKKNLHEDYILDQLDKFVRLQGLKISVIRASELINEGKPEEAEIALNKGMKSRLSLFSPGITLEEGVRLLDNPDTIREPLVLGIPALDAAKLGPAKKELHLLLGPKKKGKTWWLLHLAKRAMMHNWRVAYVTLEVRESLLAVRSLQTLFSMTYNDSKRVSVTRFDKDDLGRISKFHRERMRRLDIISPEGREEASSRLSKFHAADNLRIKEFPTGALTINGLEAYLDALERINRFVPDLLIVDYPDLMKIDQKDYRHSLGALTVELRGIAVSRDMAIATASQVNREGVKSTKIITSTDVAEDFSKSFTSDIVLTYNQSPAEYQLGLARLHVSDSRISKQHFSVMVSQAYEIGQFCLDSARMMDTYWNSIKELSGKDPFNETGSGDDST